ncbi:E3 SUMO-protein ligase ZBED1-like [Nerophis lumbriciformis]|uniref:E3 SUMO-protein ligase ZBED1-like n=1 Tax=Nerophis lumbriciformis TaxID=546530 RepID=UPI003BAA7166
MDPRRFGYRLEEDVVWERLKRRDVAANTVEAVAEQPVKEAERQEKEKKSTPSLDDLFPAEDDSELQPMKQRSIPDRVDQEIQVYRGLPCTNMQANTAIWWFGKRDTLPLLYDLVQTYLCVQASSTPSERVFSTAGDTISEERVRLDPEKADMLIFLKKNC